MPLTRRAVLGTLASGVIGAAAGVGAHGYLYERHALQLLRVTMPVSGLTPAHEGLRIGLLTDLHHSSFVSQDEIARAVTMIMAERPDLIVLGGDYVTNFDNHFLGPCADVLSRLDAPHGVIGILGNHDDERATAAAFSRLHFPLLRDARTTLAINGEPLDVAGCRYWTRTSLELSRIVAGAAPTLLLLAHDPRRLTQALDLAVPAVLSGHTHGGQVVLPLFGAPNARKFPILAGLLPGDTTSLFVSRGVGTVYVPVRLNCPPDVAIVTLTARTRHG
jgi:predicted MPP superfamily phosphohydrolase